MLDFDDKNLLKQYAEHNSEQAFGALVSRHINKVYSVALRHTRNPGLAEEITQAVFAILAKKASRLDKRVVLSGWLYQTARLASVTFLRSEIRRSHREQEAHMQNTSNGPDDETWTQIAPLLDSAMGALNETDRHAVVLRFFDGKSMREVGAALGATEDTAKKRVSRALEKLRNFFAKRGVHSTTAIIAGMISSNSIQAAPPTLAQSVTAAAIASGSTASTSTLPLLKGALKIMAWTKTKTAMVIGAGILLAAGTTTVTVKAIQRNNDSLWDVGVLDGGLLKTDPHIVRIIPSKHPDIGSWVSIQNGRVMGFGVTARQMMENLDHMPDTRITVSATLPPDKYDFIANLPSGSAAALRHELEKRFQIIWRRRTVETNVLVLQLLSSNAPGLEPNATRPVGFYGARAIRGQLYMNDRPVAEIAGILEMILGIPVYDATGLTGYYNANMRWDYQNDPQHQKLKQALKEQLGLELVPTNMPVEMLVVDKAQ